MVYYFFLKTVVRHFPSGGQAYNSWCAMDVFIWCDTCLISERKHSQHSASLKLFGPHWTKTQGPRLLANWYYCAGCCHVQRFDRSLTASFQIK